MKEEPSPSPSLASFLCRLILLNSAHCLEGWNVSVCVYLRLCPVFPPSREISRLCFSLAHLQCLVNSRKRLNVRDEKRGEEGKTGTRKERREKDGVSG